MVRGKKHHSGKWYWRVIVALLIVGFLIMPTPAAAASGDALFWTAMGIFSVFGASAIGYGAWELAHPDQPRYFNGEFYAGGYLGVALTPSQDLRYPDGFNLTAVRRTQQGSITLRNNDFNDGLVGGLKLGYFFHSIPYLGLELDSGANHCSVSRTRLATNRIIQGSNSVTVPNDDWVNWTTALHIVGRYGFLPDGEVPFGHLQPYVGIGPAIVVLYEEVDSAKNFGMDVMAGVRYMITKHISTFFEYKFNYQWDVEIESHPFYLDNGAVGRGTTHFDFATHKVVAGFAYHW
jgi:opacity protein-like surface antigen